MKLSGLFILASAWTLAALSAKAQSGPVHLPPPGPTNTAAAATLPPAAPIVFNSAPSTATPAPVVAAPTTPAMASPAVDDDIRDIRGPLVVPNSLAWLYDLAAVLLIGALAYAGWRFYRRRPSLRRKLPHEIALERLENARALMAEGRVREYAFAVSEAVRVYIEQRFGEKAARRTTEEFISDLLRQTDTRLVRHRALLEDFLHHCDLPKFARWQLSSREMESMHDSARAFIQNTEPNAGPAPSIAGNPTSDPVTAR